MATNRKRWIYLLLVVVTMVLGLSSRYFSNYLPTVINHYLGDALWAVMVFFLIGLIFRTKSTGWVASAALLFAYGIEVSQLYHAPWIDTIRQNRLGGLVLGYGFLWRDLVAYSIGVGVGAMAEGLLAKLKKSE